MSLSPSLRWSVTLTTAYCSVVRLELELRVDLVSGWQVVRLSLSHSCSQHTSCVYRCPKTELCCPTQSDCPCLRVCSVQADSPISIHITHMHIQGGPKIVSHYRIINISY